MTTTKFCFLFLTPFLIVSCKFETQHDILATFTVHSGDYERINTPVNADISGISSKGTSNDFQLVEVTDEISKNIPSQKEYGAGVSLLWWILDGKTPAGKDRKFELRSTTPNVDHNPVESEDTQEAINFNIADKNVLAYHYALTPMPEGVSDLYSRGGYIHPLWSPAGEVLTRIQPPDHYHHYGIWNPWTKTEFEGKEVDFWNLIEGQATVLVKEEPVAIGGPVYGNLTAFHDHVVKKDSLRTADKVALNEKWEIRVWNADSQQKIWLVDITSTLTCASESPLTIKEYSYQGFSLRANKDWNDSTSTLLTSEGKNKSDANGTRARWLDIKGPAKVGTSGIEFMTHPNNFNFPEQLRIWPVGMNEGKENVFVNFNPAQDRDWELKPGKEYTLNYRMMIYDGVIDSKEAESYWNDYAYPPQVIKGD